MSLPTHLYVSGIWTGCALPAATAPGGGDGSQTLPALWEEEHLRWALCLTANDKAYPSAWGYYCRNGVSGSARERGVVLHGEWEGKSKALVLNELMANGETGETRKYFCTAQLSGGNLVLSGTWTLSSDPTKCGTVVLALEPDDKDIHVSGLWLGQSEPRDDLVNLIPTNPISWCLSLLLDGGQAFGAGYFDDSADVPNNPLLLYSLRGNFDVKTGAIHLRKVYEGSAGEAEYYVDYNGVLRNDDDGWWLRGTWENPKACTSGTFVCRKQNDQGWVSFRYLCRICVQPIKPGGTRWFCTLCLWNCCDNCYHNRTELNQPPHCHSLLAEPVYVEESAVGSCCSEMIADSLERFAPRPFLGWRRENEIDFTWMTYQEVSLNAWNFAAALKAKSIPQRSCILFYADIHMHYVIALLGSLLYSLIVVPVHSALEPEALAKVLLRVKPEICVVGSEYLSKFGESLKTCISEWKKPLVIGIPSITPQEIRPEVLPSISISDFLSLSGSAIRPAIVPLGPQDVSAVLFTSGSTGQPKGAAYTEQLLLPSGGDTVRQPFVRVDFQPFHPSFLMTLLFTLHVGGRRAFARLDSVLADMQSVRPTHISAPPAFWTMLHRKFISEVSSGIEPETVATTLRGNLGGRVMDASTGGAPTSSEVVKFVHEWLHLDLADLYGCREAGGIARNGCAHPGVDVIVVPLQEGMSEITGSDAQHGEICVHSSRMIPGYYNDTDATEKAFISVNGKRYYRTGDVGEVFVSDGVKHVRILDRCANYFKLSQGEWVSPVHVEEALEQSPLVSQCCVIGSRTQPYLVAVVVPSQSFTRFWSSPSNMEECEAAMMKEIRFWCSHLHLRAVEFPQGVVLEKDPWTPENGLLTSTEKKCRPKLLSHYHNQVNALYLKIESHSSAYSTPSTSNLSPVFQQILAGIIPMGMSLSGDEFLHQIGCDSLSTATLVNKLRQLGLRDVTYQSVHTYTLSHLSELVSRASSPQTRGQPGSPSLALPGNSWSAECELPSGFPSAKTLKTAKSHILLTGATGFLGACLLPELLNFFPSGRHIYCLIRGKPSLPMSASERLKAVMIQAKFGWPLTNDITANGERRIHAIAGDLCTDKFGMSAEDYNHLVSCIGDVFHCGAHVDMLMPYSVLREANVTGTVRVARFALEAGARLHHVSSVAALPPGLSRGDEEDWITTPIGNCMLDARGGYAQTKAISERLLHKAHTEFGLDVRIFRPSTVSAHRPTQFENDKDFTVTLVRACVKLGVAVPTQAPNLHWIPSDFVSKAICHLSGSRTGSVFNLAGDGPLLRDAVVEAMSRSVPPRQVTWLSPNEWCSAITQASRATSSHEALLPTPIAEMLCNVQFTAEPSSPDKCATSTKSRAELAKLGVEWLS